MARQFAITLGWLAANPGVALGASNPPLRADAHARVVESQGGGLELESRRLEKRTK